MQYWGMTLNEVNRDCLFHSLPVMPDSYNSELRCTYRSPNLDLQTVS